MELFVDEAFEAAESCAGLAEEVDIDDGLDIVPVDKDCVVAPRPSSVREVVFKLVDATAPVTALSATTIVPENTDVVNELVVRAFAMSDVDVVLIVDEMAAEAMMLCRTSVEVVDSATALAELVERTEEVMLVI